MNFIDDDQHIEKVRGRFPETEAQLRERVSRAQFNLIQRYARSEKRVLHLIVTHGTLVRTFAALAGMRHKKAKFCGVTAIGVRQVPGSPEPEIERIANCRNNHTK